MYIRRVAAITAALLLSLSVADVAGAHPWHTPVSGGGHAPTPAAPRQPEPHVPAPHVHNAPGGGYRHTVPMAASGAHFAGGGDGGRWHHGGDHDWDHHVWDHHDGDHHDGDHHDGDHHEWHHDWGHGDIRFFPDYDWDVWHAGYWHHGWYGPRFGWWWVVSGVWFFYPVPIYPYPDPYVPSEWVAPPPPVGAAVPAAGSYWYFCPASNAYYPYVPSCPSGWQQVPAQPAAGAVPATATAAPPPPDGPPGG
ncbi:MAG TPA: hypothetical protein VLV87_11560 [Gammaproteobacteria bacterium]|nr:hypothetical protein [Gammaproteobacteria bacterium]